MLNPLALALILIGTPAAAFAQDRVVPHTQPGMRIIHHDLTGADGATQSGYQVTMWDGLGNSRDAFSDGRLNITRADGTRLNLDTEARVARPPALPIPSDVPAGVVRTAERWAMPNVIRQPPVDLGLKIVNGREARGTLYASSYEATVDFPASADTTELWRAVDSGQWVRKIVVQPASVDRQNFWYLDMPVGSELFELPDGYQIPPEGLRLPVGATLLGGQLGDN